MTTSADHLISRLTDASKLDPGMTLRQWYAGKALSGLLAGETGGYATNEWPSNIASDAVTLADALIAELEKDDD